MEANETYGVVGRLNDTVADVARHLAELGREGVEEGWRWRVSLIPKREVRGRESVRDWWL